MNNNGKPFFNSDFILGILLGVILHVAFILIWYLISMALGWAVTYFKTGYNFFLLLIPFFFLGITQVIYLLPAYIIAVNKRKPEVGKGIFACAIITTFLNSGCFGIIGNLAGIAIVLGSSVGLAIVSGLIAHYFTKSS